MNETILIKFKDGKGDGRMARFVNPDAVLHTDSHITLGGTTIYKSEVDWITYGDPVTGTAGRHPATATGTRTTTRRGGYRRRTKSSPGSRRCPAR